MNTLRIPLEEIEVGERLREVDPDQAQFMATSIILHGQMTPIEVRPNPGRPQPWVLVVGGHRMAALELAGLPHATATVFEGTALEARLREIDENLVRHELTVLDRSTFLAQRKALYEQIHPETQHGMGRWDQVAKLATLRFTADAQERLGLSERVVQRSVTLHERLLPEVRRRLTGTWLANHGSQLEALSKAPGDEQQQAIALMFGEITVGSTRPSCVADALATVRGEAAEVGDPVDAAFNAFLRAWKRMPLPVKLRVRTYVMEAC